MMRKLLLSLGMGLLILSLAACGGTNDGSNGGQTTPDSSEFVLDTEHEAYSIYQANCISCHATDLSGQMGPQTNLQQVSDRLNTEQIEDIIKNGGSAMPAQSHLSDEEVGLLANWLSTMN